MRKTSIFVGIFLVTALLIAGSPRTEAAAKKIPVASRMATMPTRTAQLVAVDQSSVGGRRWIVWDEGVGNGQSAHIALCGASGDCTWSHTWPDAYGPTIQYMGSWSNAAPTFLVVYSQGAAAQTAVVVQLPHRGAPRLLEQRDAAWVSVIPGRHDLELDLSSGPDQVLRCLRWDDQARRLAATSCRTTGN